MQWWRQNSMHRGGERGHEEKRAGAGIQQLQLVEGRKAKNNLRLAHGRHSKRRTCRGKRLSCSASPVLVGGWGVDGPTE